jgi:SagB-type dehydrogenase family enzyme
MKQRTICAFLLALLCGDMVLVMQLQALESVTAAPSHEPGAIKLPGPRHDSDTSIEEALLKRRSIRGYKNAPLYRSEISQLLWAAQGLTDPRGLRTAPSAGALYPLELSIVVGDVTDLQSGIYRYRPRTHELEKIEEGDKRGELCSAALGQSSVRNAAVVLVVSAVYERTTVKYGDRGIRYAHMEAGHAAQNVCLQAVALDLGTVVIGAFHDNEVKRIMTMADREHPLYIIPVGRR